MTTSISPNLLASLGAAQSQSRAILDVFKASGLQERTRIFGALLDEINAGRIGVKLLAVQKVAAQERAAMYKAFPARSSLAGLGLGARPNLVGLGFTAKPHLAAMGLSAKTRLDIGRAVAGPHSASLARAKTLGEMFARDQADRDRLMRAIAGTAVSTSMGKFGKQSTIAGLAAAKADRAATLAALIERPRVRHQIVATAEVISEAVEVRAEPIVEAAIGAAVDTGESTVEQLRLLMSPRIVEWPWNFTTTATMFCTVVGAVVVLMPGLTVDEIKVESAKWLLLIAAAATKFDGRQ